MPSRDRRLSDVDQILRQELEPDAASVDRVLRTARTAAPAPRRAWRLVTASAAAAAVAAVVAWWTVVEIPDARSPSPPEVRPETPALLRISNEEGLVTVTTPAGSKMIILPGDPS